MYDLNQRTMQALNNLAIVYATFEQAGANLEVAISEEDLLHTEVRVSVDELSEAQRYQDRLHGEVKDSRESLVIAVLDVEEATSKLKDCRDHHDATSRSLEDEGKKTIETKRKADDAHDRIRTHRDRC